MYHRQISMNMLVIALPIIAQLCLLPQLSESTEIETNNYVAFQTGNLIFKCESKDVPMWSWIGKNPTHLKSMAYGDKKQNRFNEPR